MEILEENPNIIEYSDLELESVIVAKIANYGYSGTQLGNNFQTYIGLSKHEGTDDIFEELVIEYPELENELEVVKIYANAISSIDEEFIPDYYIGFQNLLNESNINERQKYTIKTTTSVAGNSKLMWHDELFDN